MQYLTYEEYTEIGGTLDLTAFKRNIDRACAMIDIRTQSRLESFEIVPQIVKTVCADLVGYIANNTVEKPFVSSRSQSAGGVSESENYATKTLKDVNDEAYSIVYDYLVMETDDCGTPLLYRGAMR